MSEKKTKKQKSSEFFKKNKGKCIFAVLVVVAYVAYVFTDYELPIDEWGNTICGWFGGC